jgi:hypothetical protein
VRAWPTSHRGEHCSLQGGSVGIARLIRLFVLSALVIALTDGCTPAYLEVDSEQGRLAEAAPVIDAETTVGQTFVAQHDRLRAVEVMLVVYEGTNPEGSDGRLVFHLREAREGGRDVVTSAWPVSGLSHNQVLRVDFQPLTGSRGRTYYFFFEGPRGSRISVWQHPLDVYRKGAAQVNGAAQPGDLRFVTYYGYTPATAVADAARAATTHLGLLLPLVGLLLVPGYTLLLLVGPATDWPDPLLQIALAIGLSMALLPLLLLLVTLLGIALTPAVLAMILVVSGVVAAWRTWRLDCRPLAPWGDRRFWPAMAAFAALFAITLALRMLQARNLVVPAWVDGVHHTLIARLIIDRGQVPANYEPFMGIGPFIYHFGFHVLAAGLAWLTGLGAPQAVLVVGQLVNALVGIGVYALTVVLIQPADARGGRQPVPPVAVAAGLLAMGLVGAVSFMPAYYVTWGRYTQLAGLAVLPTAAVLTLWWLDTGRRWMLWTAGVAVAGLTLVHYRVLVFYVALVVAFLVQRLVLRSEAWFAQRSAEPTQAPPPLPPMRRYLRRAVTLAGVALLLLTPWLARLAVVFATGGSTANWLGGSPAANAMPRGLIDIGYDRLLLRAALLSFLLGLLWWRRVSIVLGVAAAVAVLVTNPQWLGYHATWLFNNTALIITLFLPMAILVAVLLARATAAVLELAPGAWRRPAVAVLASVFFTVVLASAWRSIDIVNPVTVVATEADMEAMAWIGDHTAADAGFLSGVREWQHDTYVGTDGGYWIPLLTGRRTLVPPALYTFGSPDYFYQVQAILDRLADVKAAGDAVVKELMAQNGLEYVYLGAKGSQFDLQSFVNAPRFEVAYSNGAVWIFRARNEEAAATK